MMNHPQKEDKSSFPEASSASAAAALLELPDNSAAASNILIGIGDMKNHPQKEDKSTLPEASTKSAAADLSPVDTSIIITDSKSPGQVETQTSTAGAGSWMEEEQQLQSALAASMEEEQLQSSMLAATIQPLPTSHNVGPARGTNHPGAFLQGFGQAPVRAAPFVATLRYPTAEEIAAGGSTTTTTTTAPQELATTTTRSSTNNGQDESLVEARPVAEGEETTPASLPQASPFSEKRTQKSMKLVLICPLVLVVLGAVAILVAWKRRCSSVRSCHGNG